jgi:hypothetical protein
MVMKDPKPKWWLLYGMLPLAMALLIAADLRSPSAGWRVFTESLASLLTIGAIALWVHANRAALALFRAPSEATRPLGAWIAYCPPPAPRRRRDLPGGKATQRLVPHPE